VVAEGYERLRSGARGGPVAAVRGAAALIWVEGADAASFLQGLLSNDVAELSPRGACHALLLDAKGHVLADLRVHRDGPDAFTLVVDPPLGDGVAELLERYHFSEELELIGPEPTDLLTVAGPASASDDADLRLPGRVPGTLDLVVADAGAAIASLGLVEAPAGALEVMRIEAGVPTVGVDTGPSTLVQEAGLEATAVSFVKGCYLGQETVARAQFRGKVNRRLRGLRLAALPELGAEVSKRGRALGRVTSAGLSPVCGPIGLATLRREVEPGQEVTVEGIDAPAEVVELPFVS
jgi:folate-binding protein YgfZ